MGIKYIGFYFKYRDYLSLSDVTDMAREVRHVQLCPFPLSSVSCPFPLSLTPPSTADESQTPSLLFGISHVAAFLPHYAFFSRKPKVSFH